MLIRVANPFDEIRYICPNITSLDLSRNLFSRLSDVAEICLPLEKLRTLRLTGNRFSNITIQKSVAFSFRTIEWLALNMCALTWDEVINHFINEINARLNRFWDPSEASNTLRSDSTD
jgi:Leucine-rich repeat (LRR) protein